ncbi:cyclin family protein [Sinomonas soli]
MQELISHGNVKFVRYIAFRALPPALILTLYAAVLVKYAPDLPVAPFVLLATLVYLIFTIGRRFFKKWITLAEKRLLIAAATVVITVALVVAVLASIPASASYVVRLAPSVSGVVDSLWASLIAALVVVAYLDSTNMRRLPARQHDPAMFDRFVAEAHSRNMTRFGRLIEDAGSDPRVKLTLSAVLIVEQVNRPAMFRLLERVFVLIFRRGATQGVAQVWSTSAISDERSVELAIEKISAAVVASPIDGGDAFSNLMPALMDYNDDPNYPEYARPVVDALLRLFPWEFGSASG